MSPPSSLKLYPEISIVVIQQLHSIFAKTPPLTGNITDSSSFDPFLNEKIERFFSNKLWCDVDMNSLIKEFDADATLAFYCMSVEAKCYFFPSMLKVVVEELSDLNHFTYLIPSILRGEDSSEFRSLLNRKMSDEQKRLVLYAVSLIYYAIDQPIKPSEIEVLVDVCSSDVKP